MGIIKRIRVMLGCVIALPGAYMWKPAFDEGREEKYENLRWSEKMGYRILDFGLSVVAGLTTDELYKILIKGENQ